MLGYLPGYEDTHTPNRHRSRSHNGSYADLQKLRLTKSGLSSSTAPRPSDGHDHDHDHDLDHDHDHDHLHVSFKSSAPSSPTDSLHRRPRKRSLSDGIPVERIGAVDRNDSFGHATEDLNREATQKLEKRLHPDDDE